MDGSGTVFSGPRVVVFSRDPALGGAELAGLAGAPAPVRVSSAYEAAAEILADPPAALVIDLRALTARHVRLLEIARSRQVHMLAVGALPSGLTADDLNGVRLTARSDHADTVRRLAAEGRPEARAPAAPAEADVGAPPADGAHAGRYVPPALDRVLSIDEVAQLLAPSEPPSEPADAPLADTEGTYVPEPPPPQPQAGRAAPIQPEDLLSPGELADLLGDEP